MSGPQPSHNRTIESKPRAGHARPYKSALTEGRGIKQKITEGSIMKTKFSKLFVTILIVAAVTCCGALGVFAADDANADTAAATTLPRPSTPTMTTTAL